MILDRRFQTSDLVQCSDYLSSFCFSLNQPTFKTIDDLETAHKSEI
jgi:hypothetical protein